MLMITESQGIRKIADPMLKLKPDKLNYEPNQLETGAGFRCSTYLELGIYPPRHLR